MSGTDDRGDDAAMTAPDAKPPQMTLPERLLWRLRDAVFAPPAPDAVGPLVVAGLFRAASGVGQAARTLADSLEDAGVQPARVDLSPVFGQVDLGPDPQCGPMPDARTGTLILHVNAPETDRALLALRRFRPQRWRIIGAWVWETSRAPEAWRRTSRRLSEIWAPSGFAAEAVRSTSDAPVLVAPYAVRPPAHLSADRAAFGVDKAAFLVVAMADGRSSFTRKNPVGAIAAFRRGLDGVREARLIVKLRNTDAAARRMLDAAVEGDPRIHLLDADLDDGARWSLLASADAFISLHRAEGFGLPIAEAMALGKPVVATGWSGNMDFMNADNALPVTFRLTPVSDPTGRYAPDPEAVWAEPDIDDAANALKRLASDADLRARIGACAAADAAALRTPALPLVRP